MVDGILMARGGKCRLNLIGNSNWNNMRMAYAADRMDFIVYHV